MNDKEPTLTDYLDVLFRYRIFIGIVVVVTTLSALVFSFTAPRIYEGEVTLRVALRKVPTPLFTELGPIPQIDPVASEIQIIKSRTIAEMVVNREALTLKFNNGLSRSDFDTLWVENGLKRGVYYLLTTSPGYLLLNAERDTVTMFKPFDTVILPDGFGFIIKKQGLSGQIEVKDFYKTADEIRKEIKVSRIRDTDIISLKAKAKSPELAARISNAYANSYLDYTLSFMRREARISKEFIEKQIGKMGEELDNAEAKLKTYKESTGIFILDEAANQLIVEIAKLEASRAEAFVSRRETEAKLKNLNSELEDKSRTFGQYRLAAWAPGLSNNPRIQALKDRLVELEIRKTELLKTNPKSHPKVKKIDADITKTNKEIDNAVEKALSVGPSATDPVYQQLVSQLIQSEAAHNALDAKIDAFDREINRQNRRLSKLPETEVRLAQLERNAKANEEIYTMLLNKREEARLAEASEIGDAQVIDPALPPRFPVSPKKKLNTILGFILGMVIGIGGAFLLEYVDTSVRRKEEIEEYLEQPILAMIPEIIDGNALIHLDQATHSGLSEAYQILATNLFYTGIDKKSATLVTSPVPQDGKSTVSVNLAVTLARLGNKVLIVDADLRRPVIEKIFDIEAKDGLTELLLERAKAGSITKKTNIENLKVIPAGTIPPNPPSLLGSEIFARLINSLKKEYDYVIIDTPPVLGVTDTMIVAKVVDGSIVVVRYGQTPNQAISDTKNAYEHAGAKIIGSVFNCLPPSPHYRSYYYYYYHRYYGKQKRKKNSKNGLSELWQQISSLRLKK